MSDLDYDALPDIPAEDLALRTWPWNAWATPDQLADWLEVISREGRRAWAAHAALTMEAGSRCIEHDHDARLFDLAQRAEADRAAVERVRRVSEYWDLSEFPHEATATAMRSELIAALDPKEDQ